jgi:hypothetical protein
MMGTRGQNPPPLYQDFKLLARGKNIARSFASMNHPKIAMFGTKGIFEKRCVRNEARPFNLSCGHWLDRLLRLVRSRMRIVFCSLQVANSLRQFGGTGFQFAFRAALHQKLEATIESAINCYL